MGFAPAMGGDLFIRWVCRGELDVSSEDKF